MATKPRATFEEEFAGLIYDLFRSAGLPLHHNNQERVQKLSPRISSAISREARRTALDLVKRLQAATIDGFEKFGDSIDGIKHEYDRRIITMFDQFSDINNQLDELKGQIEDLREENDSLKEELASVDRARPS